MPLAPEVLQEIATFVRGGFVERDDVVEILAEEMYEPGDLDRADVEAAVDAAIAAHERAQVAWPAETDCDRLDVVFTVLNARGIVAMQNAGYTQSDGMDDVAEAYAGFQDPERFFGYCFFHGQDLDRAVNGMGLYLAFGPIDPELEETDGPRVGGVIVEELQRMGFKVQWNGTFAQRIFVPEIDWKRRWQA